MTGGTTAAWLAGASVDRLRKQARNSFSLGRSPQQRANVPITAAAPTLNVSLCFQYDYAYRWHQRCQIQKRRRLRCVAVLAQLSDKQRGVTVREHYASLWSLSIKTLVPNIWYRTY